MKKWAANQAILMDNWTDRPNLLSGYIRVSVSIPIYGRDAYKAALKRALRAYLTNQYNSRMAPMETRS